MTVIPDQLPELTARPDAFPKTSAKRSDASFERAIDRFRQAATPSPIGEPRSGAQMFNEHGFFQPSAPAGATAVVADVKPAVASAPGPGDDVTPSGSPAELVGKTERSAYAAIARTTAAPVASAEGAIRTLSASSGAPARSGQAVTIVSPARVGPEKTKAQAQGSLARARPDATRAATARIQLAAHDTADGLDVALHLDDPDRPRRSTLRAAILGLLSRHGFRPGHVRITGAPAASSQETQ